MKKIRKILASISAAVIVSVSSLPVCAYMEDEYSYVDNPENIAWEKDKVTVYKNGKLYTDLIKNTYIDFIPTAGRKGNSDFSDLPVKYDIRNAEPYKNKSDKKRISVTTPEELEEVTDIVRKWAEKGLVRKPAVYSRYTHGCGNFNYKAELKNADDFEEFAGDYPDMKIYKIAFYPGDENSICISLPEEEYANAPEAEEKLSNDDRINDLQFLYLSCCVIHTLDNAPEPITYNAPEFPKGDVSFSGRTDLYDAIEIAEFIIGKRTFDDEETAAADFNGDGKVNLYDAIEIAKYIT